MAPTPPCSTARSVSSRIRFLSSALNLRRCGLAGTSGSGELVTKGIAILASLTMILLAALLCNYGRGKCLIDIGTEGPLDARINFSGIPTHQGGYERHCRCADALLLNPVPELRNSPRNGHYPGWSSIKSFPLN